MAGFHVPLAFGEALAAPGQPDVPQTYMNLVCGDCRSALAEIDPQTVHCVVTDPPYYLDGLDVDWRKGGESAPKGTGAVGGLPAGMKFNPRQGRNLQAFMTPVGGLILKSLKPGAFAAVFSQPR